MESFQNYPPSLPTYGQNFDDFNPFNDGRSLLDLHAGFTASLADTIGLAKWRTHKQVFWEYFEERKERERARLSRPKDLWASDVLVQRCRIFA